MSSHSLPSAETLASLVSSVTETMCGISFVADGSSAPSAGAPWRLATLAIPGRRSIRVALCSDQNASVALGAALFSCPPDSLDQSMIDDSLCELLNMAAGQIKGALGLDQSLGLPKIVAGGDVGPEVSRAIQEGVMLRGRNDLGLLIWITEASD